MTKGVLEEMKGRIKSQLLIKAKVKIVVTKVSSKYVRSVTSGIG